jgi:predicted nucleic acid-binding protein
LDRIAFVELSESVLKRAMEPFPVPVRTLDAIHLSTMEYLRALGQEIELLTLDDRLREAAKKLKISIRED